MGCASAASVESPHSSCYEKPEAPPSAAEVELLEKLHGCSQDETRPPFYAVSSLWLQAWRNFVAGSGPRPGPVANGVLLGEKLVGSQKSDVAVIEWLCAEDWHLLHAQHGGGPVLCRPSRELSFAACDDDFDSQGGVGRSTARSSGSTTAAAGDGDSHAHSFASSSAYAATSGASSAAVAPVDELGEPEKCLLRASARLASLCRDLNQEIAREVTALKSGAWAASSSNKAAAAARKRIGVAVTSECGGEELRGALQDLRIAAGNGRPSQKDSNGIGKLDSLVLELCAHEEAQITLACLLQALRSMDRMSLEIWLEQAVTMRLEESLLNGLTFVEPLQRHLDELQDRERRALAAHSPACILDAEAPAERLWRQALFAVEANDETTLFHLIADAELNGVDASAARLLLEDLQAKKASEAMPSRAFSASPQRSARQRRHAPPSSGEDAFDDVGDEASRFNARAGAQNNDDYLHAYRAWRDAREREEWRQRRHSTSAAEDSWSTIGAGRSRAQSATEREKTDQAMADARRRAAAAAAAAEDARRRREAEEARRREEEERRRRYSGPGGYGFSGASSMPLGTSSGKRMEAMRILGLPPGPIPPLHEIKAAYRRAAMRSHPDRPQNRDRIQEATAEFQRVREALDILAPGA